MRIVLTQEQARERWEGYCDPSKGCGVACCHYEGSPCEHLEQETTRCRIYATRFGLRQTVDGRVFRCAPMAEWLTHKPAPERCGYGRVRSIQGTPVSRVENGMPVVRGMA